MTTSAADGGSVAVGGARAGVSRCPLQMLVASSPLQSMKEYIVHYVWGLQECVMPVVLEIRVSCSKLTTRRLSMNGRNREMRRKRCENWRYTQVVGNDSPKGRNEAVLMRSAVEET